MKKFAITHKRQGEDTADCGPVCVQMVLEHFGIQKKLSELIEQLEYSPNGTSAFDNGSLLLDAGLHVEAVTGQPILFSPDTEELTHTREGLLKVLDAKAEKTERYKKGIDSLKRFLEKGGELKIEIPAFNHIKEAIDNERPIIALMYGGALGANQGVFHFVVVNGYDEDRVLITIRVSTQHR